jgi:hypothetical protein
MAGGFKLYVYRKPLKVYGKGYKANEKYFTL